MAEDGKGGTELNDLFYLALKLPKSLWTVGCLDVHSAFLASARCCSEIKHPQFLEEPKSSHACSHKTLISPHTARALSFPLSLLLSPLLFLLCDNQVRGDGVGVHL